MAPRILGLITCTAALQAPLSRPPRAAPARAVKSALLSDYVLDLEKRCSGGDGDACDAIAQLDGFAKSLEQKRARRAKAAELLRATTGGRTTYNARPSFHASAASSVPCA